MLDKKRNLKQNGALNLGDSLKLNKHNKNEGWTLDQEQNRINFEDNDVDENMLSRIANNLDNNQYGVNLNTQEIKNIKNETNDFSKQEMNYEYSQCRNN